MDGGMDGGMDEWQAPRILNVLWACLLPPRSMELLKSNY